MSTGISAGVDDWPCLLWSLLILKLQIFSYTCIYSTTALYDNNYHTNHQTKITEVVCLTDYDSSVQHDGVVHLSL